MTDPRYEITNEDCMDLMARYPDKHFDLAIVDPPYGIGFGEFNRTNKDSNGVRYKADKYKNAEWDDTIPTDAYFIELQRVSKHQIVWGGNYFPFLWDNGCKGFIFWFKQNPVPNFSKGELAWTSFDRPANCFNFRYYGSLQGETSAGMKYHPTQKPIELYKWLLKNYAQPGQTILDTHGGSMSSVIAALDMGFHITCCELDKEYFEAGKRRVNEYLSQLKMVF